MPYINQSRRQLLEPDEYFVPVNAGELNYMLTSFCWKYLQRTGGRYQDINDVLGALEGAKLEFYRRVAAPYEDEKIKENGDVYV